MRRKPFSHAALFAVFLALEIFLARCDWPEEPGPGNGYKVFMICTLIKDRIRDYRYEDMMDGTIQLTMTTGYERYCYRDTVTSVIFIKKCLQGQVYQPGPNNCQGTGSAPDWGAQKLQFCPTNDRSCEDANYKANPLTSPAAASCAADTTAGRAWRLPDYSNTTEGLSGDILDYLSDLPGGSEGFWTQEARHGTETEAYLYGFLSYTTYSGIKLLSNGYELKNIPQYVLCISD